MISKQNIDTKQNINTKTKQSNNYKSCQRKAERGEDFMQKYLHEHFLSEGHNGFIYDAEIIFIDKTDQSEHTRREEFWRTKLKTLAPYVWI